MRRTKRIVLVRFDFVNVLPPSLGSCSAITFPHSSVQTLKPFPPFSFPSQAMRLDFGHIKSLSGQPLRGEFDLLKDKLVMIQGAFQNADQGFFQAYLISAARKEFRSMLFGAPPSRADDLWQKLDDEFARLRESNQTTTLELNDIGFRLRNIFEVDDSTWEGSNEQYSEASESYKYMVSKLVDLNDSTWKRWDEVPSFPPALRCYATRFFLLTWCPATQLEAWNQEIQQHLTEADLEEVPLLSSKHPRPLLPPPPARACALQLPVQACDYH